MNCETLESGVDNIKFLTKYYSQYFELFESEFQAFEFLAFQTLKARNFQNFEIPSRRTFEF